MSLMTSIRIYLVLLVESKSPRSLKICYKEII
jgi:hypothetical protein